MARIALLDRLSRKQSATTRLVASLMLGPGQPVWTPVEYQRLAKEGYQRNTWVYACVSGTSDMCKGVPQVLYRGNGGERGTRAAELIRRGYEPALRRVYGRPAKTFLPKSPPGTRARAWAIKMALERKEIEEVDTHPILDLFHQPNPDTSGTEFREAYFGFWLIAGNSYVEGVFGSSSRTRPPVELWTPRPDRMRVIPDAKQRIGGYVYRAGSSKVEFDRETIMHTKFFHPTDDWYGMSPIEAAARAVDRDNAAESWNTALLQNGARPSGALTTDDKLDDEQFEDLRSQLDARSNPRQAGRPFILEGGLKWQEMGLTPRDMDWLNAQRWSLKRICAAYHYPVVLLDPEGSATFANYEQARKALYMERVLPLLDHADDDWNRWLVPKYGTPGLFLASDVDGIEALQEDVNEVWERTDDPRMMLDERRQAVGLDELPNGEGQVFLIPATTSLRKADDLLTPTGQPVADPNAEPGVDPGANPDDPAAGDPGAAKRRQKQRKAPADEPPDWWQQGAEEWMLQTTAQKVTLLSDFTRATLAAIISTGVSEGESMQKIAQRIRQAYADMSQTRSMLIARTEVIGAANAGGRFAALSTGLNLEHEWLATVDERTRPDHLDADGQRRKIHEPFNIGGHHGMFPGDPQLPADEVCNCRCTAVYVHPTKGRPMEARADWWGNHDRYRSAWEQTVEAAAARRFAEEGATIAKHVEQAKDSHAARQAVDGIDRAPWLKFYRGFYTGVMEDFGGRVLEALR